MTAVFVPNLEAYGLDRLRSEFPVFESGAGQSLHYLDNAATTQKPMAVIEAMRDSLATGQAPIHRGLYPLADAASAAYEGARARVAEFIGAAHPQQLLFTRSATESINQVAWGWARPRLRPGERIWVTRMEHHANFLPWQRVCAETGAELRIIELTPDGLLDLASAEDLWDPRTRLIALCHVSNVLGVENPVAEISRRAREAGIAVLVDAAQSVSHMPIDVSALDCDFMAFSAHKLYGPGGIGALYARTERLDEMEPLLVGGGMVDHVDDESASWAAGPARFEAGSPNLTGAVGFAAAVEWLTAIGMPQVQQRISVLTARAVSALASLPGVQLLPDGDASTGVRRSAIVSFTVDGVHPHDVAQIAGEHGVALRAGHHCCQPLLNHLGLAATARASFGLYNSVDDIDALVGAIGDAISMFRQ